MCSKSRSPPKRVTFDLPHNSRASDNVICSTQSDIQMALSEQTNNSRCAAQEKSNTFKKSTNIKKVFVRHSELEVPTNKGIAKRSEDLQFTEVIESDSDVAHTYKARYAVPELFSALCIAKEFQDRKVDDASVKSIPVPVSVKQIVDGKAASKLNFSPEEQLFKDLVNLNVNDEMLIGAAEERSAMWKLPKDEEPKLSDFYQPKFVGEYTSLPEPSLTAIGKIRNYNGFSTYKRMTAWTSPESP